jgi:hypothetical protein
MMLCKSSGMVGSIPMRFRHILPVQLERFGGFVLMADSCVMAILFPDVRVPMLCRE